MHQRAVGSASAQLNLRLVPGGVSVAQTLAEIRAAAGDGVRIELNDATLNRMHGNDERIRVDALLRGTEMRPAARSAGTVSQGYRLTIEIDVRADPLLVGHRSS